MIKMPRNRSIRVKKTERKMRQMFSKKKQKNNTEGKKKGKGIENGGGR